MCVREREMTTIRRFCCNDFLRFASVNLESLSVTFNMKSYMTFMGVEPQYFLFADAPGNRMMGYVMGRSEKREKLWHGHISALFFTSEYPPQQFAKNLMNQLEDFFDYIDEAYFADVNVRASNTLAINLFEELGFVIYERRKNFFFGKEDVFNMRKALSRDVEKKSLIPPRDKTSYAPDELYTVNDDDEVKDEDDY